MEHTKGPWRAAGPSCSPLHDAGDYAIHDTDGAIIAETFLQVSKDGTRPAEANAKLMAASPRMLEALCQLVHDADALLNQRRGSGTNTESAIRTARAAIEAAS